MGFIVKNTTLFGWLDLLCPHSCTNCGRLGAILCECCKNNMLLQREPFCPICKKSLAKSPKSGKGKELTDLAEASELDCPECESLFEHLYAFGWRERALKKLIEGYKYQSQRAASEALVELMDAAIPKDFDKSIVVVPLPTIGKHIRERGFDHTLLLAKKLARKRHYQYQSLLSRAQDTVQVGAKVAERQQQAEQAYTLTGKIDPEIHYLLLDDVWTTGASMLSAAKVLQKAGAKHISGVVCAVSRGKE